MEEIKNINEFKNYLIGQKEGLQYALDITMVQVKSLQNGIELIDEKLKNVEKYWKINILGGPANEDG